MNYLLAVAVVLLAPCTQAFAQPGLPTTVPATLHAELDVTYGKTAEQVLKLDIYRPKGHNVLPACVLIHGGGWLKLDKERFRPLAIGLAERGYVVANVEYRLGTVAKYPAAVQDCSLAVRWVRAHAQRLGCDPERIGVWGGSAGGHLAGMLAGQLPPERFVNMDLRDVSPEVQATCVMAGLTDLTEKSFVQKLRDMKQQSNAYQWLGKMVDDAPELYREASPVTHFTEETGPVLFLTGDLDHPTRDESGLTRLQSLGVPTEQVLLKDGKHGCWMRQPWYDQCIQAVDQWFQKHL